MSKPKLLDLFCCEGVGALGYAAAGFDVTGVDLEPRFAKRYPFTFVNADAIEYVKEHGHEFDAIHASPPCQRYSITNHNGREYPDLIGPTRAALVATGKPYVIENVEGAPLAGIVLCWSMFNDAGSVIDDDGTPLRMERHRLFESNVPLDQPRPCYHPSGVQVAGSYGGARRDKWEAKHVRKGGYVPSKRVQQELLGVSHATLHGMWQSIPPAYTHWVGSQLMAVL